MDFPGFIHKIKYTVPCKYTLFNSQGHIFVLQWHKVCKKTRYFNAWMVANLPGVDLPSGGGGGHPT
jgi:hypothetical protein